MGDPANPLTPSEHDVLRRERLQRLQWEIAKGEADIAAGHFIEVKDDDDLAAFFALL